MSRRSSISTLGEAESISLEYDDYPLDLVATTDDMPVEDLPLDLEDFNLDLTTEGQATESAPMLSSTWSSSPNPWATQHPECKVPLRKMKQKDAIRMSEEIITDYGRRSWCDYEVRACPDSKDVFVASEKRLSQLIAETAQYTVEKQLMNINEQLELPQQTLESNTKKKKSFEEYISNLCVNCKRYFLVKHNPLPNDANRWRKLQHGFLCPPHGQLAHYITLFLGILFLWTLVWAIIGHVAITGAAATLFLLYISGFVGAKLTTFVRLPPYLGMVLSGLAIGNCFPRAWITPVPLHTANLIRHVFLSVSLLYISLFTSISRRYVVPVVKLAFLPAALSVAIGCVASHFLQVMPWTWALAAGLFVSCTCPVYLGEHMQLLQNAGHGLDDNIPGLAAMAGGLQAAVITCFTVIGLSINTLEGWWVLLAIQLPLEVALGCIIGSILACLVTYFPNKSEEHQTTLRMLLFVLASITIIETSCMTGHPVIGPAACLVLGAIIAGRDIDKTKIESAVKIISRVIEPMVFTLLGFCIDLHQLYANDIGAAFGIVLLCTSARFFMSYISLLGLGLSLKDKLYITLTLLPCASIQMATLAVTLIIILSPFGGKFRIALGKHLLPVSKLFYEGYIPKPVVVPKEETISENDQLKDQPEITEEMEATV